MKIKKGLIIERNNIRIDVHFIKDDEVYYQKWPKDVERQLMLENLFRMSVDEFESQCKP